MNENNVKNEGIDGLLTNYFQSQLPNPWPACQALEGGELQPHRRSPWTAYRRWAVAASVAALLAGYLALAGFFPREADGRLNQDGTRNIAHKSGPGQPGR